MRVLVFRRHSTPMVAQHIHWGLGHNDWINADADQFAPISMDSLDADNSRKCKEVAEVQVRMLIRSEMR